MSATAVENRTLPELASHPYDDHDDRYTVASSASTSFTVASNYTTNTDNYTSIPVASRLSRHTFKIRTTSSFPSILNLYQEPIREEPESTVGRRSKHKEGEKGKRLKRSKSKGIDWSGVIQGSEPRKSENRAIRIEAIAREQMEKYESYIKNLHGKVEKQRAERQRREEMFEERLKAREEEERLKYSIKKRPKHEYVHDKKFLKKIPKSKLSKMVQLSDDLQKKGVLRSQHDVDKFWKDFGDQGLQTDIFKRDPLQEVPDNTQWMSEKSSPPKRKSKHKHRRRSQHNDHRQVERDHDDDEADDHDVISRDAEESRQENQNEAIVSDSEANTSEHRHKKSRSRKKSHGLPPLEKKREKHRKKAKSWPDRDPGALESEPTTAREV